jgi:hypothetical protein
MNLNGKRTIFRLMRGLAAVLLTVGITTGLVLASLAFSRWVNTSPVFNLNTIVVAGNRTIEKEDIVKVAGLERGRNIWSADLVETGRRLMLDRRFEHVAVNRRLPDAVVVRVKELQPVAFVQLDRLYGISERAELIPLSPGNGLPDLPVITIGASGDQTVSGVAVRPDHAFETLRDAMLVNPEVGRALYLMRVLRTISPGLYDELSEVHVSSQNDPIAYMVEGGLAIRFGTGHYPRKIEMLKRTVERLEADAIRTRLIDLRFKDQVIVRPIVSARSRERRS